MTTLEKDQAAPAPRPSSGGRFAALAPYATALRVGGGLFTVVGAYLPWVTFVLNEGAYPEQATLEFFTVPFGVTGFRLHLLLFGVASIVLALVAVPAKGRIIRALGVGVLAISLVNGLYIVAEGGGLGAITVADGVAFGAIAALIGGALLVVGALAGGLERQPVWTWQFNPWIERALLIVVVLLMLLLVAAVLTSGGTGGSGYSGAVFLSFLGAVGGLIGALSASGLLAWVTALTERHRLYTVLLLLAAALLLPLTAAGTEYWMTVAATIGVYAATAIGLNIVVGLAGLLDLGYVAFLGIGAFVAANLSGAAASQVGISLPFPLVMIISAVVAGIFGAVVGSPTLRVRGDYLAIVTLAFGEIFVRSAQNNIGGLTGGSNAIPGIPPVSLFGNDFNDALQVGGLRLPPGFLYYVLIVLIISVVMVIFANLKYSRLGRAWIAIREDEDAARAMGIRTGPIKILAFLIGAMLAGFAGAFYAHKLGTASYESFRFLESVTLLAAVILGGMGTIPGAVIGASVLFVLPEKLREFAEYRLLLFGIALIIIMRFRPQGLVPDKHRRAELAPETDPAIVAAEEKAAHTIDPKEARS
jgi:branched-chain amino acid transport system permease protein